MSFFFSSRRRHTRFDCDWSSDVCSSDLYGIEWKRYISFVVISFPFDAIAVTSPQYSTFQPCDWDQYWLPAAMPALPYFSGEAHASANCEAAYGAGRNQPAQGERSYHAARVSAVPRPS